MKYLVIGLGVFGTNLSIDLTDAGGEVIGVDTNNSAIENIKDYISTTYRLDTTDENSLSLLPLSNIDVAIVAIGDNFGASIKTTALLKKLNVKRIMVRAIDSLHHSILEGLGVERILTPEKTAALSLVSQLSLGTEVDVFAVNADHYIFQFPAPEICVGRKYEELNSRGFYGLTLVAASRKTETRNMIGITTTKARILDTAEPGLTVEKADILTFYGPLERFRHLSKEINEE